MLLLKDKYDDHANKGSKLSNNCLVIHQMIKNLKKRDIRDYLKSNSMVIRSGRVVSKDHNSSEQWDIELENIVL